MGPEWSALIYLLKPQVLQLPYYSHCSFLHETLCISLRRALPVNASLRTLNMSMMGVVMPAMVPIMLPKPRFISIRKNITDQKGEAGKWVIASVKAMNARPVPCTDCTQPKEDAYVILDNRKSVIKADVCMCVYSCQQISVCKTTSFQSQTANHILPSGPMRGISYVDKQRQKQACTEDCTSICCFLYIHALQERK